MEASNTSNQLLQRLAAGDSIAQFEVFQIYYRRLVGLVDANVADRLTRRIDGSDVALSAMNSLFQRVEHGQLKPGSYQELWRILAGITMNKLRSHVRYHTAQRRSIDAEKPSAMDASASKDSFPEDLTILRDELRASIEALKPYHRSIAIDVLAGEEPAEIARRAGRSIRTVARVERQLEDLLRARLTDLSAS